MLDLTLLLTASLASAWNTNLRAAAPATTDPALSRTAESETDANAGVLLNTASGRSAGCRNLLPQAIRHGTHHARQNRAPHECGALSKTQIVPLVNEREKCRAGG